MKISAGQIVDVNINLDCLDVECNTLNNVLQALVDKVCDTELPSLDFKCLPQVTTQAALYQALIDKVCETNEPAPTTFTMSFCQTDTWACGQPACIPSQTTLNATVQALIARVNSLTNIISSQCTQIANLQSQINQLTLQVNNLDCC